MNDQSPFLGGYPLPDGMRKLIDVAGEEAAIAITLEWGGGFIDVPKRAQGSRIEQVVGAPAAARLCKEYGGERLLIPLSKKPLAAWMLARGVSVLEVSRQLRITRKTVQNIKNGQTPSLQGKLL